MIGIMTALVGLAKNTTKPDRMATSQNSNPFSCLSNSSAPLNPKLHISQLHHYVSSVEIQFAMVYISTFPSINSDANDKSLQSNRPNYQTYKSSNIIKFRNTFPRVDSEKEPLRTGTSGNMSIAIEKKAPNTWVMMMMMTMVMMRTGTSGTVSES